MPATTLRPNETIYNDMTVFEHYSAWQALSDDQDGSAISPALPETQGEAILGMSDIGLPSGAVVIQVQARYRYQSVYPAYACNPDTRLMIDGYMSGVMNPGLTVGPATNSCPAYVAALSEAQLNGIGLYMDGRFIRERPGTGSTTRFIEAYLDVWWANPPGVVVTGPSGTSTSLTPTMTWIHQPGADAQSGQTYYRIRLHNQMTGDLLLDTGEVPSGASSAALGSLGLGTYVAFVATAQTTNGVNQWTAYAGTVFTINVTPPVCAVTGPTGTVTTTRPTVTWTHTPSSGAQTGQTYYRVRVYAAADLNTILFDSGEVGSAANSLVIGPLDPLITSWRAVVNTAQTTAGVVQWSVDASRNFNLDVTPALIASVAVVALNDAGALQITVSRQVIDV